MNQLDKFLSKISLRLERIEESTKQTKAETEEEIAARFAELREARAKKTNTFGDKTYEDVWDNITQEELDHYMKKNLEVPPEQRYQKQKEHWYFHKSSWYYRGEEGYDGHGCNGICVPECRYYHEKGRIEDEEVLSWYENKLDGDDDRKEYD